MEVDQNFTNFKLCNLFTVQRIEILLLELKPLKACAPNLKNVDETGDEFCDLYLLKSVKTKKDGYIMYGKVI